MSQITHKNERKIMAVIIAAVSGCVAFGFYSEGLTGFRLFITAFVVLALKFGEFTTASDVVFYAKQNENYKAAGFGLLCSVLFGLSVTATSFSWYSAPQKQIAKLDLLAIEINAKKQAVEVAEAQLLSCNPRHVTKCIKPMSELLSQKQTAYNAALSESTKLSDIRANQKSWQQIADFFGTTRTSIELSRDILLGALFDLLGMFFYAQSTGTNSNAKTRKTSDSNFSNEDFSIPVKRETLSPNDSQQLLADLMTKKSYFENSDKPKQTSVIDACKVDRMLVVGKMGAGKTSLLAHIAEQKSKTGLVLILDPHAAGQWPKSCQIVGGGRNYEEIETMLKTVIAEMDKRFKQIHNGEVTENNLQPITVLFDEFTSINSKLKNAGQDYLLPLLTEGRKALIHVIAGGQDETAGALGLKGFFGLKNAFDLVLRCKNISGQRTVEFDNSESKEMYEHPGAFNVIATPREAMRPNDSQEKQALFHPVFEEIITNENVNKTAILDILDAVAELGEPTNDAALQNQEGYCSYRKLTQKIWGEGKHGSHWNKIVNDALRGESASA